ncbi:nickel/cobalt transporter [Kribbia dieselivorans]|uniref:nickel/cobalt transporter n=1 Tax=Kribbia dieselivorans TaxID=331526 RepID=UPI000838A953|nr:hypothetical protein [Kribbia dieselivorans]
MTGSSFTPWALHTLVALMPAGVDVSRIFDIRALDDVLVRIFDSPSYQALTILVAFGIGAAHALAPGHGKSITAAYLVGEHGTYKDAVLLGVIVAAMHTISAVVLAAAWVSFSQVAALGTPLITGLLQATAGIVIIWVGVSLVRRQRRGHGHTHTHAPAREPVAAGAGTHTHGDHAHGDHTHDHHSHDHGGHGHSHELPEGVSPFTRTGLVALGMSGGLIPSPASFLVLISGMLTGRTWFAVFVVLVFGIGLAVTISFVGYLTITGREWFVSRAGATGWKARVKRALPQVGAYAVVFGGLAYLSLAVQSLVA